VNNRPRRVTFISWRYVFSLKDNALWLAGGATAEEDPKGSIKGKTLPFYLSFRSKTQSAFPTLFQEGLPSQPASQPM